jgi:hypothetical protein
MNRDTGNISVAVPHVAAISARRGFSTKSSLFLRLPSVLFSQTLICHSTAHIIRHRIATQNRNAYIGVAQKDYLSISRP